MSELAPKNQHLLIERLPVAELGLDASRAISRLMTLLARPSSEYHQDILVSLHFRLAYLIEGIAALEAADKELHALRLVNSQEVKP